LLKAKPAGAVTGTITDTSGAVIVGASVVLKHTKTGVRLSNNSNEAGIYRFDAVDLGTYEIKVTHPGFRPFLATMVRVDANRATTIDPDWNWALQKPLSRSALKPAD
jgi:Carboxypeptidase regulatory-like domain